jgi:hypothetical protein
MLYTFFYLCFYFYFFFLNFFYAVFFTAVKNRRFLKGLEAEGLQRRGAYGRSKKSSIFLKLAVFFLKKRK